MAESIIAVAEGEFRFNLDTTRAAVSARWPSSIFVPASGRLAALSAGQFEIPEPGAGAEVMLEFDLEGRSLSVEARDPDHAAEVIAWATELPGFPENGSVILAEWAVELTPLAPGITADDLLEILA